jgi:uncharacterized protein
LNSFTIALFLTLALLAISLETASGSALESPNPPEMDPDTEQIPIRALDEAGGLRTTSTSHEMGLFKKVSPYLDVYILGGISAALLTLFIYPRRAWRESKLIGNFLKTLYLPKILKIAGTEEIAQENFGTRKCRFFISIPILCIALAEILIFLEKGEIAVWIHIGSLIALSLSNILVKESEIQKIYQALMLLPILRLINLSMPIFFETTLYTFIFIYGSLAIPVAIILIHQKYSLEQIGISMKNIRTYMVLSIPLSFILGLGEYLTIRADYLIPDLTVESLLKLTFVMVFFVGLVEELIFRSILQTRLGQVLSTSESLLITSLLFGFMHSGYGTPYEIIYTTFVGFLMGLTFCKTKSLPFVAVVHGFINVFLFGIFPHYFSSWAGF